MKQLTEEVDQCLPPLADLGGTYPITLLESSLPYMRDYIKENFRDTPVFTMPLARYVTALEGMSIDGHFIPQGVSSPLPSQPMMTGH